MNPYEFARNHLGEWKQKGSEIVPKFCPYCHGGEHRDRDSFALNVDKLTFNCKRGTCGKQGHFTQLCRDFGEDADRSETYEMMKPLPKVYKKPETVVNPAKKKVEDYLKSRGFSKETWERRGVGEHKGNIAMPYRDENGELVFMKFRKPEKYTGNGQKAWREAGGKPILWGMDLCDCSKPLVIVEGEMDALALDEAGVDNVTSVPSGNEDLTWIENCWEWLERFEKIIIWGDNDDPGRKMVRNIIARLGDYRCATVESQYKDANIALFKDGKEKTKAAVLNAKTIPVNGLIELADVMPLDIKHRERTKSGIAVLDEETGGFLSGQLSVWTGKSGAGKSSFLGQLLLESVEDGQPVCAYSGELTAADFQYWINLQAAGPDNTSKHFDTVRNKYISYIEKDITARIKEWYRGKFWLYDNEISEDSGEEKGIIKLFAFAAKKYGCKVFLVDNLMTSRFDQENEKDFYLAQAKFVSKLVKFATTHNVHVHLVAHPNKARGNLIKEDISGRAEITNLAHNVFSVERATENPEIDCDTVVKILKSRSGAEIDKEIGLMFDKHCKRFWQKSNQLGKFKKYGWEKENLLGIEVAATDCPF
jgi:twinkle protein